MVNLNLPKGSSVIEGKTFGKDGKDKIIFNVYRWNRESNSNPRLDKFYVDKSKLGPMVLDALMFIKAQIDPNFYTLSLFYQNYFFCLKY